MLPQLPARKPDSHKGHYGRGLLIGGSLGMAGSISLAGQACLRSGAGLVTLAIPKCVQAIVAGMEPSYMTLALSEDAVGRIKLEHNADARAQLQEQLQQATALAVGPGLGASLEIDMLVAELCTRQAQPMVIDADGLNAVARRVQSLAATAGPRILTPHPGEFGRLASAAGIPGHDQISQAVQFASRYRCVIVLKGHRSLITDGEQNFFNETGNPGMATGGSGDVLTGVITALLCQGMSPLAAAQLGCHVHGLAGDLAAAELGQVSMIASDLLRFLPAAWKQLQTT
jgi:ADP-dependent NAD(P)H-hydrate dehydratase